MTNDERQKIVHALLTPIFMMGQRMWLYLSCQYRQPILWLCIVTTKLLLNYLTYKTKNCWHSIDAHIQNGAGRVWLSLVPKKPANTTFMNGHNRLPRRLPMMQDVRSLTLCWHSFCHGPIHNMLSFNLAQYIITGVLAAFVPSSCTFSFINTLIFNNTHKYIL